LNIPDFENLVETITEYYAHGGIGYVCRQETETLNIYFFASGLPKQTTQTTWTLGVTSASALSIRRGN
jgi:hypothetical protein